jgi:hypothetical protein
MRPPRFIPLLFAHALFAACTATPLPTPPSLTMEKLELTEPQAGQVALRGAAGAIQPAGVVVRVTGPADAVERPVAEDGSFAAALGGTRADVYWLEIVQPDESTFVGAVTGGPGTSAVPANGGPDRDADESPDAIDCAADDPAAASRSCAANDPAGCANLPETCNGLDDDCDGSVDDGTCACNANDACNAGQECAGNTCTGGLPCNAEADCLDGQTCDAGICR